MKRWFSFVLALVMAFGFAGCSKTEYPDTNGEANYTLQTIRDEQIVDLSVGASGLKYSESSIAGVLHSSEYSAHNFNGAERIYLTNFLFPSDISVYIGHFNVDKGNFKLIAVCEDEIICEFAPGTFSETFIFRDLTGTFAIYAAGESAKFSLHLEVY